MNNLLLQQTLFYINGVWRRRWVAILIAWLVSVAGWIGAASLPDVYESSARIYVDTSNILTPLLSGIAVDQNVQNEISFIQRTLTSRPNLEKISRMTDLDITAITPSQSERLLEIIQDRTVIKAQGSNLYYIGFTAPNPKLAKNVVQSYLTLFVEANLGQSRQDRDSAREFLDDQIRDYEVQLSEAETRLAEFKRDNYGLLPGERGFQATLAKAQESVAKTEEQYRAAIEQRDAIKAQLEEIPKTVQMPVSHAAAGAGPPSQTESRIIELEGQIDAMLQVYTEQHPDVATAKKRLEVLEKERDTELRALAGVTSGPGSEEPEGPQTYSLPNKVYEDVKLQQINVLTVVKILEDKIERGRERLTELESRAARVPAVEAALTRLDRDYSVIKQNHDQLLQRRESARLSRARTVKAEEVQFRVVEPPVLPNRPIGPNRGLFVIVSFFVGLAAGVGFACLRVVMSGTVSSAVGLRELFELPVLGVVSVVEARNRKRLRVARVAGFAVVLALLVGACGSLLMLEQQIGLANALPVKLASSNSLL